MQPTLAFDTRVFETTENAELRLGEIVKNASNPLFREAFFAEPPLRWEARYDNLYPSVITDDEEAVFKCWYSAFIVDEASNRTPLSQRPHIAYKGGQREEGVLYATSTDGSNWEKPALGIIEFEGSRSNNLVMRKATHGIHAGGVFKDLRDPDPARRYKYFHRNPGARRMAACFSADGLTWSQPLLWPERDAAGDTHNNAIWAPELGKYVGITRGWTDGHYRGLRTVLRSESADFIHWTKPLEIMRGADAHDQIYSMPIARYGDVYIGLPAIFRKGDADAPDWDRVDTELAWSPDTVNWERVCPGTPLIPRGAGSYPDGDYDCGCVYAAAPLIRGDRILIYYGGSNGSHNGWREGSLNLATLEKDRFAAFAPQTTEQTARLTTALLRVNAETVTVNIEIADGGCARAGLLGADRSVIPGFGLDDCLPLTEGGSARALRWKGRSTAAIAGAELRVVIELDNAKLYALAGLSRAVD